MFPLTSSAHTLCADCAHCHPVIPSDWCAQFRFGHHVQTHNYCDRFRYSAETVRLASPAIARHEDLAHAARHPYADN